MPSVHWKFGPFHRDACSAIYHGCGRQSIRPHYLIGAVLGAIQAKNTGIQNIALVEFGVATGLGLRCLLDVADVLRTHLDLTVHVVGFDNRTGLPAPRDYRDHPEIWSASQFAMGADYTALEEEARRRGGELVIGDVSSTLPAYKWHSPDGVRRVIAFCSIDVDYYSSTTPITSWLGSVDRETLLPATPLYFDDVIANWTYSDWAGEGLAIREFNEGMGKRKIELKNEQLRLFALHAFDHPVRTGEGEHRVPFEIFLDELRSYWWK